MHFHLILDNYPKAAVYIVNTRQTIKYRFQKYFTENSLNSFHGSNFSKWIKKKANLYLDKYNRDQVVHNYYQ